MLEVVAAIALGILVLWLVFEPSVFPGRRGGPELPPEPEAPEETRRGVALLALKEIEFDRATGKLSDADYEMLKSRYSAEAVAALDAEERTPQPKPVAAGADPERLVSARLQVLRTGRAAGVGPSSCLRCGPRPEPDARFCSRCGLSLAATGFCVQCGAALRAGSHFCSGCGNKVAA